MSWRTVVLTRRAKVEYRMGYMVIRGQEVRRVFMDEVQVVILASTAISLTAAWVSECIRRKIKIIFCNEKRNPAGEILPYYGCYDSSRQITKQIRWTHDVKKKVWAEIVKEKIRKQAELLQWCDLKEAASMLLGYVKDVIPGDATNREGTAAKVYFRALYGSDFSRRSSLIENGAMNYGYAILLSLCNREICAAGYLTQIGIFHGNVFNAFNLGSDLMEPWRPLVDRKVIRMPMKKLGKEEKVELIDVLNEKVKIGGKRTTVSQAMGMYCRSVFEALESGKIEDLRFYENDEGWSLYESTPPV